MFDRKLRAGQVLAIGLLVLCLSGLALLTLRGVDRHTHSEQVTRHIRGAADQKAWSATIADPSSLAVVRRVEPEQAKHFSILRTPPEPLGAHIRKMMRRSSFGANWNLAQRTSLKTAGSMWLIPGNGFICLLVKAGGLSQVCAPTGLAVKRGVAGVELDEHPEGKTRPARFIAGVAPDSAVEVIVRTGHSIARVAVSHDGVFLLRDDSTSPPDLLTSRNG